MAKRVAAQRRGLLYGMIAALFVAVILAVFLFMQMNELQNLRKLLVDKEVDSEVVQTKLRDIQQRLESLGVLPSEGAMSLEQAIDKLVDRTTMYEKDINDLGFAVTGQESSSAQGAALHNKVLDVQGYIAKAKTKAAGTLTVAPQATKLQELQATTPKNLVAAIDLLDTHVRTLAKDYETKVAAIRKLEADKVAIDGQRQTELANQKTEADAQIKTRDDRITKLEGEVKAALEQSDRIRKDYEDARKTHNEYITETKKQLQERINEINLLNSTIKELSVRIARAQAREFEPDGRILNLDPGAETGFINLGKGDGVFNGLTFVAFDPTELGKEKPQAKGFIRLTNVMENSSEFYIVGLTRKSDPIVEGDLITNAAFDRERPFNFAVVGRMDINGDGAEDTEWVKTHIRRVGGKVQDQVTVQTDYLVVGDDPMTWLPPSGATPSPQQQVLMDKIKKEQAAFGEATDMAQRLHIPVLNQNRFLSLIGIAPMASR